MRDTPLQAQKNQLMAQQNTVIRELENLVSVLKVESNHHKQAIAAQKSYINSLKQSEMQQKQEQELMRKENLLLSKKLKDMNSKSIEQDKIIKLYQEELQKEISLKELIEYLETLKTELETHFKMLLKVSYLRPLIQQEIDGVLRPYLKGLKQLESVDWSTLQDSELSVNNVLKTLNDLNKK